MEKFQHQYLTKLYSVICKYEGDFRTGHAVWHVVPMESVSLRSYSDAYPCHRVPTHGLII